jgi:aspartyl-tRNA(Asn)/glutamyl-tRNA(Gln) amidotransferase subunit C
MALDKATVAHIAALARIRISEDELEPLAGELSRILDWVEQLNEVDLPMREDVVTDGGCRDAILGNAPSAAHGFFTVPKVVE